ncbi:MAG: N-6 DNA methylase [Clostridia bacterium]|nr:N-6 DNA methylase [Clostridia bacterium]
MVRGNELANVDWQNTKYPLLEYVENDENSGCTLILANPPFIKEKDPQILKRYSLAEGKNSVDAQTLFLERGLNLLRPGGRMLIVLPEGILSNDDSIKTREYILKNAKIKAIIELPTHTFVQSGVDTINTVILYLEKYETDLKNKIDKITNISNTAEKNIDKIKKCDDLDYDIFLASVENVGFEPNGRIFVKNGEKTDLDIILEKFRATDIENQKINIINNSLKNYEIDSKNIRGKQNLSDFMRKNIRNIENRLDPSYYLFWKNIGEDFDDFIPLSKYNVKWYNNKLKLLTEEDLDKEFIVCSVNKNNYYNLLEFSEYKTGDELSQESQKKMIVNKGTIVYNPYRASIGSFSVVPEEFDNCLTSGAYYNFSVDNFDEQLLVTLFKTPIYNKYIKILSTGSVRDNFSDTYLEKILVPKINRKQQKELLRILSNKNNNILDKQSEIRKDLIEKMAFLYKELNI